MATYSKIPLSNSSNGKTITIGLSALPGTTIHATGSNNTNIDEVWLYAANISNFDNVFTLYWGGSASNDIIANVTIEAYAGLTLVVPGLILTGTGTESNTIVGISSTLSAINVSGYINRITA
jgi:hypothetical protein